MWLAMLNYITDSYPSVAASAIAAFSLPSFTIAAALVHAGIAMFDNMSTTWAVFVRSQLLTDSRLQPLHLLVCSWLCL